MDLRDNDHQTMAEAEPRSVQPPFRYGKCACQSHAYLESLETSHQELENRLEKSRADINILHQQHSALKATYRYELERNKSADQTNLAPYKVPSPSHVVFSDMGGPEGDVDVREAIEWCHELRDRNHRLKAELDAAREQAQEYRSKARLSGTKMQEYAETIRILQTRLAWEVQVPSDAFGRPDDTYGGNGLQSDYAASSPRMDMMLSSELWTRPSPSRRSSFPPFVSMSSHKCAESRAYSSDSAGGQHASEGNRPAVEISPITRIRKLEHLVIDANARVAAAEDELANRTRTAIEGVRRHKALLIKWMDIIRGPSNRDED